MKDRQFRRVRDFLKRKRPGLAICTYTLEGVDVIRGESNSRLGRGTYHDTQKATWRLLTAGRRQLANAAVHFIAIPYRHAPVPVPGIRISLRPAGKVRSVRLLRSGREVAAKTNDAGRIQLKPPPPEHYDVVLIRYD